MAATMATGAACYAGPDDLPGVDEIAQFRDMEFNTEVLNTARFNTLKFNTFKFNSFKFNSIKFNSIKFNSIKFNSIKFNTIALEGSEFVGVLEGEDITRRGVDLIGTELELEVFGKDEKGKDTSEMITMRFDDIYLDPEAPGGDVFLYDITYKPTGVDTEWKPLCATDNDVAMPSIPLKHYWNETTGDRIYDPAAITFACTDAVLGKCVQWGYRPWGDAWECPDWDDPENCDLESLRDHHQACTRMARADYCGDGTPWTVAGTPIDIWDHLYEQIEIREAPQWQIEAEWTPDGAYCLQDIRQQGWKQEGKYPKCTGSDKWRSKPRWDCGTLKHHRALLVSAFDK